MVNYMRPPIRLAAMMGLHVIYVFTHDSIALGQDRSTHSTDGKPDIILIASGPEVSLVVAARQKLQDQGVMTRAVSMPSWELFDAQPQSYRHHVLLPSIHARLAVEAGASQGWASLRW